MPLFQRCETRYGCPVAVPTINPETGATIKRRPKHKCKARWYGFVETGVNERGTRDRPSVSAKTRAEAKRKLKELEERVADGNVTGVDVHMTVRRYVDIYLDARTLPPKPLSPNAWNAAASALRKWVVGTIGNKRLEAVTPADIRSIAVKQYDAGNSTANADAVYRALMTMLRHAKASGYRIPDATLMTIRPGDGGKSDRTDLTLEDSLACLGVAANLPNGIRWALALLYGVRQGEALGLVETDPIDGSPCIDWDDKVIHLRWQLQDLQRVDRTRPELGYRIPRDYEAIQLRGMYHLVRPKSKKGYRTLPLIPAVEDALRAWIAERPKNPWGLVFPASDGRPMNDKVDRAEWLAIQQTAAVEVDPSDETRIIGMAPSWRGHPSANHPNPDKRRWYHIHECRNFAATQLDEAGASDNVIMSMLGHASIVTSRGYMTAHLDAKRAAAVSIGKRLRLTAGAAD